MPRVRGLRGIKPHIWIPPTNNTMYKLTVERKNGTVDDVTDLISYLEIEDGITDGIGTFRFELWNPDESYTKAWTGNEIIRFYKDYATSATTLRFRGRIEKSSYRDNKIRVSGRSEGVKWINIKVTYSTTNTETSEIFKAIVDKYNDSTFTYNNVNTSTTNLTVNWYEKPFWECVKELTDAAGFDSYLDANLDFHYFETNSVSNTTDAIVHTFNLISVGDFAEDLSQIRNRVTVYGAEQQGIQIIHTEESTDATYGVNSDLGVRTLIVNNDNVTNQTQAEELATALLDQNFNPPVVGEVKSVILATLQPGESIKVSSPENNIPPQNYQCYKYKDVIDIEGGQLRTTVTISKEPRKIYNIMSSIINEQNRTKKVSINPNQMKYSYNFLFSSDTGDHTNTEITDGVLKVSTGSSGTWISPGLSIDSDMTEAYLVMNGETLTDATISVSGNNGADYQEISNRNKIDLVAAKGKIILIKVELSNADTQITSLSLQYNRE